MEPIIIDKLINLQKRFNELKNLLEHPKITNNYKLLCTLSKEYADLSEIITHFENWLKIKQKIIHTKSMLSDENMHDIVQDELKKIYIQKTNLENNIKILLLPKDPNDNYGCFLELRAGTGGKEATIFTGELFRMYSRYLELKKWNINIVHITHGELEGYKEIIAEIPYPGAYGKLKFESGGHRVQRIPYTESQGRIHTSTCTVAILPKIPYEKLHINPNDLRIDTFRSSGAGGQHVNTTDSAIRVTHIPSSISVTCQDERSQHKNKAKALSILNAKLYALDIQKRQKSESIIRRNLIGTGDRSDRIRTYNFQQSRITDHRIDFTSYKLNDIMNGDLDVLITPIISQYYTQSLDQLLKLKS